MKICQECNRGFSSAQWTCPQCGYRPEKIDGFVAHAKDLAYDGGGFKAEYFKSLEAVEASSFWFRSRNEIILWALRAYKPEAKSFFEIGCGTGFVLSGIAQHHPDIALSGSEIFVDGLKYAAQRLPHADLMQMDGRHVPFENEFDVIGAFDVLEHIREDEEVLTQLLKALKPGGILLLTVPQHPWLWSRTDDYACHIRRYTQNELANKCTAAGMRIEKSTSFVTALLPFMLVSRWLNRATKSDDGGMAELRLPPFINRLFYAAMTIDKMFIRCGVNLPVGGSRLVVARKAFAAGN
ncbi:class I SAM-dependent methyltransferase [Neorhizobium sp. NPDC001467]|uniref:class I SAM-dependent methyltransferase n=1 Tax=Neorhizobium sp. NPDC001467 TaxID=3390595 RepID=UPI003D0837C9